MIDKNFLPNRKGIVFVDIDETIFRTFAKVHVLKNGSIIKKLSNKEFNSYVLNEGESFDFSEFADGKFFKKTSVPIATTFSKLKKIINIINEKSVGSRIVFLTARSDFIDKEDFLDAFREQGLDIDNKDLMYIERAGNLKEGSVSSKKKKCILKHLQTKMYNFCQLIDDDENNVNVLREVSSEISEEFFNALKTKYCSSKREPLIIFQGYLVSADGVVELVFENKILCD